MKHEFHKLTTNLFPQPFSMGEFALVSKYNEWVADWQITQTARAFAAKLSPKVTGLIQN